MRKCVTQNTCCARRLALLIFATCAVLCLQGCSGGETSESAKSDPQEQTNPQEPTKAAAKLPKGDFIRLTPVQVMDTAGFGKAMPATTLLLPSGWKTQGGVVWQINNRGCGKNNPHFAWAAASPDGMTQVQILPEETWGGNNLQVPNQTGCPNVWLRSAQEYLQTYVQYNRPEGRIRKYEPRPDIAKDFKHLEQRTPMPMGELRTWVDAGQVFVDYTYQGQQFEEVIAMMIVFRLNRMQGVYPGEVREFLTMSSLPGFAMRAPRGKLNLKLAETIRTSGKANPQWVQLITQHNMKMAKINRDGATARHKIRMDTIKEIGEINRKGYENRQRVMDEGNKKFSQVLRDVESFNEPDGSEVELPSTHANAWKLDDGTYILTDDHSFQPFKDLGIDGQQLARRQ